MNEKSIRYAVHVRETSREVDCKSELVSCGTDFTSVNSSVIATACRSARQSLLQQYQQAQGQVPPVIRLFDTLLNTWGLARPKTLRIIVTVKLVTSGSDREIHCDVTTDPKFLGRLSRHAVARIVETSDRQLIAMHQALQRTRMLRTLDALDEANRKKRERSVRVVDCLYPSVRDAELGLSGS